MASAILATFAYGEEETRRPWAFSPSLAFAVTAEQLKNDQGQSGGRLFQNTQIGLLITGTRTVVSFFDAGLFFFVEKGIKSSATYAGVDGSGVPTVTELSEGNYSQLWLGPLIRGNWKFLFLELGYVLVGKRQDSQRANVPSTTGDSTSAFSSDPLRAWLITLGGRFALSEGLDFILRIEYRHLYYRSRGGNPLINDLKYGTQAIRPHLGLSWSW